MKVEMPEYDFEDLPRFQKELGEFCKKLPCGSQDRTPCKSCVIDEIKSMIINLIRDNEGLK